MSVSSADSSNHDNDSHNSSSASGSIRGQISDGGPAAVNGPLTDAEPVKATATAPPAYEQVDKRPDDSSKRAATNVEVSRQVFTENDFQKDYEHGIGTSSDQPDTTGLRYRMKKNCTPKAIGSWLFGLVPILTWLPKYNIKKNAIGDLIGGITVGISRIPIAMAYALLASLPAVYGLYLAFYIVLIYAIMGTSRHIAIGCEAVTAIMIAAVLDIVVDQKLGSGDGTYDDVISSSTESPPLDEDEEMTIRVEAASCLLLMVAMVQFGMFVFRLGIITTYFSEPLIRSFTNGACCHIFTSQFKELFGIRIPRIQGYFELPKAYIEIFSRLSECNTTTLIISLIAMSAMVIGSELLDYEANRGTCRKRVDGKPHQRLIIPTDLFVVIAALFASTFGNFAEKYGVAVIGDLPPGLKAPVIPKTEYFDVLLPEIFPIAIVGFAISYSAGKVYAKKYDYDTNANQELLAYSTAGFISSFFHCYPFSTSLGRSAIQVGAGGNTQDLHLFNKREVCSEQRYPVIKIYRQVAGLLSSGIILLTLYLLAPLLSQLPKCCLAVMIIVAMRGIFRQFADLPKLWRISLVDFLIWVVTWTGVILLGVHIGLYIGIVFSLFSVIVKTQHPVTSLIARVKGTDIYRDEGGLKTSADELPGIKIFRLYASLCFVNAEYFKKSLYSKVGINPRNATTNGNGKQKEKKKTAPVHTVIIDCSMIAFIDVDGMQTLQTIVTECQRIHVNVFFSNANNKVQTTLLNSDKLNTIYRIQLDEMFVTLHDAVQHALSDNNRRLDDTSEHKAHFEMDGGVNQAYVVETEHEYQQTDEDNTNF